MVLTRAETVDRFSIVMLKLLHGADKVFDEYYSLLKELNLTETEILMFKLVAINTAIFVNEDEVRQLSGKPDMSEDEWAQLGKRLLKTHRLNANRSSVKGKLSEIWQERIDPKLNYVNGEWAV